jgi:hypothetical protein
MGLTHMPRSSPSNLVFKFACATQQVLDLVPEIDKKQLSDKHRGRLRARLEELTDILWPSDAPEDESNVSKQVATVDKPLVSDVRWEPEANRAALRRNAPSTLVDDVESITSSALKTAKAKIQKLEAEVAKMQTEPPLATVPVNHFRLTRNDDEMEYSYGMLYADYARGSTSATISEPYVEKPHQVKNIDAFIRCVTSAEPRLASFTLITLPGKTEAVESYLALIIRTWAAKGVNVHVQHDQDAHARYINFSTGLRVRGDRCLDIYRRPPKKGMPRSCLAAEIFIERVRTDQCSSRAAAARDAKPQSDVAKREQGRKRVLTSPVKRSPVKILPPKKKHEDPSPLKIWRERQSALLQSTADEDVDMDKYVMNIDRERADMMSEHAAALARERYEDMHYGNGMKNEEIRQESQSLAVWDLHRQHLCGGRYVGDMYRDGTIHYFEHDSSYTMDEERIIRLDDPYVFRVRDDYHQLFIDHYFDGADVTSSEPEDNAESVDSEGSNSSSGE